MNNKLVEAIVAYNNLTSEQQALFKQVLGIKVQTINIPKVEDLPKKGIPDIPYVKRPWDRHPWETNPYQPTYPFIGNPVVLPTQRFSDFNPLDIRYEG